MKDRVVLNGASALAAGGGGGSGGGYLKRFNAHRDNNSIRRC